MEQLGIEPVLLFAQMVNFIIIIFVLRKILYKPILETLEKRRKEIAEGVELTERLKVEEEKLSVKRAKVLETARSEAQAIITEAKHKAKEESDAILEAAGSEAAAFIEKGKAEIAQTRKTMEKEMRTYAVSLAVSMAKRLLSVSLPDSDKGKILDKHLKELSSVMP